MSPKTTPSDPSTSAGRPGWADAPAPFCPASARSRGEDEETAIRKLPNASARALAERARRCTILRLAGGPGHRVAPAEEVVARMAPGGQREAPGSVLALRPGRAALPRPGLPPPVLPGWR